MKIVFSYISDVLAQKSSLKLAALSNFLAQKQGFKTEFWGDKITLQNFKNIEYDDVHELNLEIFKHLPGDYWSMGKLLAIKNINEPFLHVDCDLLLFNTLTKEHYDHDIVCFHDEHFLDNAFEICQGILGLYPDQTLNFPVRSYNCGIMGGNDFKSFHYAIDILLDFIKENGRTITHIVNQFNENQKLATYHPDAIPFPLHFLLQPTLFAEQIWMFQIFKSLNKEIHQIMPILDWIDFIQKSKKYGFMHLMNRKSLCEKPSLISSVLDNVIQKNNINY